MSLPLVSCIMPTKNRREFVLKAIEYFLRQTYQNRELIIGSEGEGVDCDLYDFLHSMPSDPLLRAVYPLLTAHGLTLGEKRNVCCRVSNSDLIAHWDDDDWYGPTRLADQVSLMQSSKAEVCGLDAPLFYDLRTGQSYRYHFADGCPYGATLMYTRKFWEQRPFADIQVGETGPFLEGRWPEPSCGEDWFIGMIHDANTCPKALQTKYFSTVGNIARTRNNPLGLPLSFPVLSPADVRFYQGLRERMGVTA